MSLEERIKEYAEWARASLIAKYASELGKAQQGAATWIGYDSNGNGLVKQDGLIRTVRVIGNAAIAAGSIVMVDNQNTIEVKSKAVPTPEPSPPVKRKKPPGPLVLSRPLLLDQGSGPGLDPVYLIGSNDTKREYELSTDVSYQVYTGSRGKVAEFTPWDLSPVPEVSTDEVGLAVSVFQFQRDNNPGTTIIPLRTTWDAVVEDLINFIYAQSIDGVLYCCFTRVRHVRVNADVMWSTISPGGIPGGPFERFYGEVNPCTVADMITVAVDLETSTITQTTVPLYESILSIRENFGGALFAWSRTGYFNGLKESIAASLPVSHPFSACGVDAWDWVPSEINANSSAILQAKNDRVMVGLPYSYLQDYYFYNSRFINDLQNVGNLDFDTSELPDGYSELSLTPWALFFSLDAIGLAFGTELRNRFERLKSFDSVTKQRIILAYAFLAPVLEWSDLRDPSSPSDAADILSDCTGYSKLVRWFADSFSPFRLEPVPLEEVGVTREDVLNFEGLSEADAEIEAIGYTPTFQISSFFQELPDLATFDPIYFAEHFPEESASFIPAPEDNAYVARLFSIDRDVNFTPP